MKRTHNGGGKGSRTGGMTPLSTNRDRAAGRVQKEGVVGRGRT